MLKHKIICAMSVLKMKATKIITVYIIVWLITIYNKTMI